MCRTVVRTLQGVFAGEGSYFLYRPATERHDASEQVLLGVRCLHEDGCVHGHVFGSELQFVNWYNQFRQIMETVLKPRDEDNDEDKQTVVKVERWKGLR